MDQVNSFKPVSRSNYQANERRTCGNEQTSCSKGPGDVADVSQMGYSSDVDKLNKELGFVTASMAKHQEALERITARLAEVTEKPEQPDDGPVR